MATLLTFQADLDAFAKKVDVNLGTVLQKIATDLFTRIIGNFESHRHPVDTGRARAGWALSIGAPVAAIPPELPKEILAAHEKSKGPPILPAPAVPDVSGIDGTQAIYIVNNVDYIGELENGHSKQAPNGFVKLALLEIEAQLASV